MKKKEENLGGNKCYVMKEEVEEEEERKRERERFRHTHMNSGDHELQSLRNNLGGLLPRKRANIHASALSYL